jgi:hypothetical protein
MSSRMQCLRYKCRCIYGERTCQAERLRLYGVLAIPAGERHKDLAKFDLWDRFIDFGLEQ